MKRKFVILLFFGITTIFILSLILFRSSINFKIPVDFQNSQFYKYYSNQDILIVNVWSERTIEENKIQLKEILELKEKYDFELISYSFDRDTTAVKKLIDINEDFFTKDLSVEDYIYKDSISSKIYPSKEKMNIGSIITVDETVVPYIVVFKDKEIIFNSTNTNNLEKALSINW